MVPKIRSATLLDLRTLENFQKRLVALERPFDTGIPKKGKVEYYNIKELTESKNVRFLVAEINNKIVGCGFGQIRKNSNWAVNKNYGYIGLMFVDNKFRGQKVGRLMRA